MQRSTSQMHRRMNHKQGGMSIVGLIMTAAVIGFFMLLGFKVVPTYVEYRAIVNAVNKAKTTDSPAEIKKSFEASAEVTYIDSIHSKDLIIVKSNDGGYDVGFSYEKRIPLVGFASLVLDYEGSTAKGGVPLAAPAAE